MKKFMLILVALATLLSANTIAKAAAKMCETSGSVELRCGIFEVKPLDSIKESDIQPPLSGDGMICTFPIDETGVKGQYRVYYAPRACEAGSRNFSRRDYGTYNGRKAFRIATTKDGKLTGNEAWMIRTDPDEFDPVLAAVNAGNTATQAAIQGLQAADAVRDSRDKRRSDCYREVALANIAIRNSNNKVAGCQQIEQFGVGLVVDKIIHDKDNPNWGDVRETERIANFVNDVILSPMLCDKQEQEIDPLICEGIQ